MPQFYITANASQYVSILIEADSEQEAREKIIKLPESDWEIEDQYFEINQIEVVE
jgi:hypothetical protein